MGLYSLDYFTGAIDRKEQRHLKVSPSEMVVEESLLPVCNSPYIDPLAAVTAYRQTLEYFAKPFNFSKPSAKGWDQFKAMGPITSPCKEIGVYGKDDEEKRVCLSPPDNKPCSVVSIGSKNEFEFELDVAAFTGCDLITLDCTMKGDFRPPPELEGRGKQYKLCADAQPKPNARTISQMMKMTATGYADYVKADIEGSEFSVLEEMIATAKVDDSVQLPGQIAVEVHTFGGKTDGDLYCFMSNLFHETGYVLAHAKNNRRCSGCLEALLVRVRCSMGERQTECL